MLQGMKNPDGSQTLYIQKDSPGSAKESNWLRTQARLADLGATTLGGSPADFGKLIGDETEKWGKVIRAANIKID
jgi:hypothetical protein